MALAALNEGTVLRQDGRERDGRDGLGRASLGGRRFIRALKDEKAFKLGQGGPRERKQQLWEMTTHT